jgi:anti-sigma regulatory factor (Ser/Thr protein kinase)
VEVEAHITRQEATFVIRDEGPGFDPRSLPDPTLPENIEKPCGRGLLLMRTFMDSVAFNSTGNEVTMIKRSEAAGSSRHRS